MTNRQLYALAAVVLVLITAMNSFFRVDQRERAVVRQFGEIIGADYQPGLHFKIPFVQTARTFDGRLLTLDNQTENFLTLEKKNVKVDFFVKWRVIEPATYYRATGGEESVASDRLAASVNRSLRDEFANRTIQQALAAERAEFTRALDKTAKEVREALGIDILDVRVKRIDFPDDVREKVYERMRAERTRVASELRAKGAEEAETIQAAADQEAQVVVATAYSEAELTRGDGDAKAAATYAAAYGKDPEFYRFHRSLQAYKDAMSSSNDILVIEADSEFFRYFKKSTGK